jgi:UDP-2,3-diacylglucosamine pyrophosphatase LpxH
MTALSPAKNMILNTANRDSCHILKLVLTSILLSSAPFVFGQSSASKEIAFVSDTQEPMWVETVWLHANHNTDATELIFNDIIKEKPLALFILGDVVMLGYKEKKWKAMDKNLAGVRNLGIEVNAVLGNHDVMTNAEKGEQAFEKRFPKHVRTGYFEVVDSVAIVLLNSNFKKLSPADIHAQQRWLSDILAKLDADPSVLDIIVTCHHAPYTNSKIVGCSVEVQENFVPAFIQSKKSALFITGHAHAFEHFKKEGKDFLTIGGGGGIHQPLYAPVKIDDLASGYKPMFHYLTLQRNKSDLAVTSHFVKEDFSGVENGISFIIVR